MRAAVFAGIRRMDVVDVEPPVAGPRDVVVSVDLCGVCGSDVSSYDHGAYVEPGQVMGHEVCGRVLEIGSCVEQLEVGAQVAVLPVRSCGDCTYCRTGRTHLCGETAGRSLGYGAAGGFADRVLLRDVHPGIDVVAVSDDVSPEDLVWAEPVAVAVHAVGLLDTVGRFPVLVTGAGSVGLCATAVLVSSGTRVAVVEPREDRRRAAGVLGAEVFASIADAMASGRFSRVLDTSGSPSAIKQALEACSSGGRAVLVGLGPPPLPAPRRGITLQGSFAYTASDFGEAVALISEGAVRLGRFITHRYPLAGAGAAIAASAHDADVVKAVVVPASREESP